MIKKTLALFFFSISLFAQHKLSHPIRVEGEHIQQRTASSDTLKILAVMVQFQKDEDSRTSGNGQFDLSTTQQKIIDAPPRDSAYFADHFYFAKNYFTKASNGKQNISSTVLGTVITLPKKMQDYAQTNNDNTLLARLAEETWRAADSLNPKFPFQQYNVFIIFHAGSGKDVDLRGSLGYDPTPYDLPSLYFSLNGFRKIFGL